MAFRFVHSADLHLDSPLRSLALRDADLAALVGTATRTALERIVALCLEERVDALLLAGDLYDGDQTSMKTARFLAEQMRRLDQAGIGVFVIRGNHDNEARITKELHFPDRVKVFRGWAEAVAVERPRGELPIVVHGLSFAQKHVSESMLPRYKAPVADAVNIGLMHTSLGEPEGLHARYAPCALADLQASGFRYWALGHIHGRFVHEGDCTVVMPGMPQGRDIGEAGVKSVTLVTVGDDHSVSLEARPIAVAQFARVAVEVAAGDDWAALAGRIDAALGAARDRAAAEHLVARLDFTGATELAWRMRADQDLLAEQAMDRAGLLGRCWIDKVQVSCRAPEAVAADDPLVELGRLMREEVAPGVAFRDELTAVAAELRRQLPPECRGFLGDTPERERAALDGLLGEGVEEVLARLRGQRPA